MSKLIEKAKTFATIHYQRISHVRKYSNKPYQTHLAAVAKLVSTITDDEEMIATAWLHDTVEYTPAILGDIENSFNISIAELVNVASIRINGKVQGFIKQYDLKGDVCGDNMRHYTVDQVINGSSKLNIVIHVLTRHDYSFVTTKV